MHIIKLSSVNKLPIARSTKLYRNERDTKLRGPRSGPSAGSI